MTVVFAILIVLVVTAYVAAPLLARRDAARAATLDPDGGELWNREKAVAVLAIAEADFDRATGKLSDEDYRVLRSDYEGRALQAMDEIEKMAPATESARAIRYCGNCGTPLAEQDAFCGGCGQPRPVG